MALDPRLGCSDFSLLYYSPFAVALEQADKGRPERAIEYGVDDGIDRRGDIAKPKAGIHHVLRHLALGACGKYNVQDEERRPAQNEGEKHQSEHLGGLLLRSNGIGRHAVSFTAIV